MMYQSVNVWPLVGLSAANAAITVQKAGIPNHIHRLLAISVCGRPKVTATNGAAIVVKSGANVIWRAGISQNDSIYTFTFPDGGLACLEGEALSTTVDAGGTGVFIELSLAGNTERRF